MTAQNVYLKQNVLVEPLFNQWYAWSCLIAPATSAMFIANSHMKIMQSFVQSPQTHVAALKNPSMRGGPFINYGVETAPAIRALMDRTTKEQANLLELAGAIKSLSEMLTNESDGTSLEPLYQRMPESLKGYVELVYDLNDSPSIRFIEGLLYKSKYYDEASQSIELSLVEQDDRPFALSTPALGGEGRLGLNIPFSSPQLDELFKMKSVPQPIHSIKQLLGVRDEDEQLFGSFFTEEAPTPPARYTGDGVRVRYYGHACILIESANVTILTDPLVSYKYDNGIPRYTFADLPETIDYVLITHNHQDHCMFETLLQLRHKIRNIIVPKNSGGGLADPSLKFILQSIGFPQVREIDELEAVGVDDGAVTGIPFLGEHADLNIRTKLAYSINLKGRTIMCAADSNNLDPQLYEHIHQLIGDVDVVFLGMECDGGPLSWLYGPLLTRPLSRKSDQSRRLNGSDFEKALDIVDRLHPQQVYVYAMGQEPWLTFLTSIQYTDDSRPIVDSTKLVEACRQRDIESERLFGCKEILLTPAGARRAERATMAA